MTVQKSKIGLVLVGLLLGILMAAMDNTIVVTAMGTIVGDLGGLEHFVWVMSAYMITELAGMPIFGKLSDMYGRKRFFLFGATVFMIGSALCGTADTISQLSIYRGIQGIGAGALIPIASTILFDIFPPESRGKIGGIFGAAFGLSSIFGPLVGAYLTDFVGWHWVFYINLPLGVIAFLLVVIFYKETKIHQKQSIDWWGAITLVGAVVCLLFFLELGGQLYQWNSPVILGLSAGFIALFVLFLFAEKRAKEPIISFEMFKKRLFAGSNILALLYGGIFMAAVVYIPIFVQGVYGGTATNSGLILLPMMLSSVVTAQVGGILSMKVSYRNIMVLAGAILTAGFFLLSTLTPDTSRTLLTLYMVLVGLGVGFSFSVLSMAAIHHFDFNQRGAATSTNNFIRNLGMTIGIAIFGIIQKHDFSGQMEKLTSQLGKFNADVDPNHILSSAARSQLPEGLLSTITDALASSIVNTFTWALIPAGCTLLIVFWMSNERMEVNKDEVHAVQADKSFK